MKKDKYYIDTNNKLGKKCTRCKRIRLMKYYYLGWKRYKEGYSDVCKVCTHKELNISPVHIPKGKKKWRLVFPEDNNKQFNWIIKLVNEKYKERKRLSDMSYKEKRHPVDRNIANTRDRGYRRDNPDRYRMYDKRKNAKRKRNLGFIILFDNIFPDNTPVDYHHISDGFVIPIPRYIHQLYGGKFHRDNLKYIIEDLYNISYIIIIVG